ncbi:hypothetical protein CBR_g50421 [Chara braunii]|uniref:CCHC-type domain-containing protein n=1 Tax=Chara braunii TaxID=69332 RepID=A0A388M716_CHABU|nr:hypothetical protein CBR_g50421 [Chara braunii]|eukprot:GBG90242.1 hypothetical protein CBR_g50421 [Chara braunii]
MSSLDRRDDNRESGGSDRRPYRTPTCYNCQEPGHYANQCPNRDRKHHVSRPATSSNSRRTRSPRRYESGRYYSPPRKDVELREKLVALSQGFATMKEHIDAERAKKEEKARRKMEKVREKEEDRRRLEEEEARRQEEEARQDAKKRKKQEKAKKEAILRAEMKKDVTLHAAMMMNEIKDDWINSWKTSVMLTLLAGTKDVKGKKKVECALNEGMSTDHGDEGSETSVTQELNEKTRQLCINEKRKREDNVGFEDSPPMQLPPKRTPRKCDIRPVELNERMARSKAKKKFARTPVQVKRRTPIKTPLAKVVKSAKKKSPPSGRLTPASRALTRLRYRDAVLRELKDCSADELQRICREEGLHYEGKVDAILDIAEYRSRQQFPEIGKEIEVIPISESVETGPENTPADDKE